MQLAAAEYSQSASSSSPDCLILYSGQRRLHPTVPHIAEHLHSSTKAYSKLALHGGILSLCILERRLVHAAQ